LTQKVKVEDGKKFNYSLSFQTFENRSFRTHLALSDHLALLFLTISKQGVIAFYSHFKQCHGSL